MRAMSQRIDRRKADETLYLLLNLYFRAVLDRSTSKRL